MAQDGQNKNDYDLVKIDAQLKRWRERLLCLTKGNPLLGINRSRVSKLLVSEPDSSSLFDAVVVNEKPLKMPLVKRRIKHKGGEQDEVNNDDEPQQDYVIDPGDIEFNASPKDLFRLIRRIYDNGRTTFEERGVTTLHLAFGVLNWEDQFLGESESPLLLVPCQLESRGPNSHMQLKMLDEELRVNPALELYLRERHHVKLPEFLEEPTLETLKAFFNKVTECTKEQGWRVQDVIWLSTFSFESLVIYNDLIEMAQTAHRNLIVAAFARAGSTHDTSEAIGEDLDNLDTPQKVPIPVMPTDASQLHALSIASAGKHLVIHGPPGTGKSQTITNLIADALGKGKKVLFVSAKMAALDVVYRRLSQLGLGRYCLEAHSTKAGKAKIIEELKKTLESPSNGSGLQLDEQLAELKRIRKQLNEYVQEVHMTRQPLGITIYKAIGFAEKLHHVPTVEFDLPWADVLSTKREQLTEKTEILETLAVQAETFNNKSSHPWRGYSPTQQGQITSETLRKNLQLLTKSLEEIHGALHDLTKIITPGSKGFTVTDLTKIKEIFDLIAICEHLPKGWGSKAIGELHELEVLFGDACIKAEVYQEKKNELAKITPLPLRELHILLKPLEVEYASRLHFLKPNFWKWRSTVKKKLTPGASNSISSLHTYIKTCSESEATEDWFRINGEAISHYVVNPVNNVKQLKNLIIQFRLCQKLLWAVSEKIIKRSQDDFTITTEAQEKAYTISQKITDDALHSAISFVNSCWPNGFIDGVMIESIEIASVIRRSQECVNSSQKLHEWSLLQETISRCNSARLESLLQGLEKVGVKDAPRILERRFYEQWVESVLDSVPALKGFSGAIREDKTARFRELDAKVSHLALMRIQAMAAESAKKVTSAQNNFGSAGEVGILRLQLQKHKRFKPLRKLFAEIPSVLQAIKPCMLMSPISVSTFLKPGSITFDLVVFDEASQLPTQEAIPSILRAKQVVIAGDENQLPPTSFFLASSIFEEDYDDDLEELEPLESLLNNCVAAYPPIFSQKKIIWHYRSKDERLIKFSNHFFYNNSLITFPSTTTSDEGRGVHLVYVKDGVWDRGRSKTNRIEAQKVAEFVIEYFKKYPGRSLGVVAMSASQKEAIEYALDDLVSRHQEVLPLMNSNKAEPFFIKSLENVQGDERDAIVISVGYAKTAEGVLSLNFGPLNNKMSGWRRLNVLVTRTKWEIIIVTSLRSQELTGINPNNKSALMLRSYIEYAERGAQLPSDPAVLSGYETNDFEDGVAAELRNRGLVIDEQVGASAYRIDLAIRDPRDQNRYVMAVECDGATYHHTRTARDRDLLRQEILRSHGWRIHRLWSTDWFRDREMAIKGILRSLEIALKYGTDQPVYAPPTTTTRHEAPESNSNTKAGNQVEGSAVTSMRLYEPSVPYQKTLATKREDPNVLLRHSKLQTLADATAFIVNKESPIHESVILERLKEVYKVSRAGSNIQRNVSSAIRLAETDHNFLISKKGFIYKNKDRPMGFRTPLPGEERSILQIAPEEIENAILYLIEDQFGFAREKLPKAVLNLFGLGRSYSEPVKPILLCIEKLINDGTLRVSGFTLYLA